MAKVREVFVGPYAGTRHDEDLWKCRGSTEQLMLQNFPPDFEYILSLQESVSVAMADAYSQDTGKPVHVNLHSAAGSGNGMGANSKPPGTTARR